MAYYEKNDNSEKDRSSKVFSLKTVFQSMIYGRIIKKLIKNVGGQQNMNNVFKSAKLFSKVKQVNNCCRCTAKKIRTGPKTMPENMKY